MLRISAMEKSIERPVKGGLLLLSLPDNFDYTQLLSLILFLCDYRNV